MYRPSIHASAEYFWHEEFRYRMCIFWGSRQMTLSFKRDNVTHNFLVLVLLLYIKISTSWKYLNVKYSVFRIGTGVANLLRCYLFSLERSPIKVWLTLKVDMDLRKVVFCIFLSNQYPFYIFAIEILFTIGRWLMFFSQHTFIFI